MFQLRDVLLLFLCANKATFTVFCIARTRYVPANTIKETFVNKNIYTTVHEVLS